ncbi:tryptophan 7-halogenase [Actinacidiphila oryziradicis]|uniref:tryptophan 7-halogenase n=1 Tax=Actinacidiphila oryziradicis TaxID=2571141 RepID=UPI0023EF578D|nr:tryptophan 7-halogenase [Actinacidiphila oryziradicis]
MDGTRWTSYAWHFGAQLVADLLRRFSTEKQGIVHVEDKYVHQAFRPRAHRAVHFEIGRMFDDTRDFIQGHFSLAPRNDTPFWLACKELELRDGVRELLEQRELQLHVHPGSNSSRSGHFRCWISGRSSSRALKRPFSGSRSARISCRIPCPRLYDYLRHLHNK